MTTSIKPPKLSQEECKRLDVFALNNDIQALEGELPLILNHVNSEKVCGRLLVKASKKGSLDAVKLLLPFAKIDLLDGVALLLASQSGHADTVKHLLTKEGWPQTSLDKSLIYASQNGHAEVVKHLLVFANPKSDQSKPLQKACMGKHVEIFNLLYSLSDPQQALRAMNEALVPHNKMELLQTKINEDEAKRTKKVMGKSLASHMDEKSAKRKSKM